MKIGHRHLGGGNQVVVQAFQLKHVLLELGQLAGTGHAVGVTDKGREDLCITLL